MQRRIHQRPVPLYVFQRNQVKKRPQTRRVAVKQRHDGARNLKRKSNMKWKLKLLQRGKGYITKVYVRPHVHRRIHLSVLRLNSRYAWDVVALLVVMYFLNQFNSITMYEIKILQLNAKCIVLCISLVLTICVSALYRSKTSSHLNCLNCEYLLITQNDVHS